jgi:hypothetical protein
MQPLHYFVTTRLSALTIHRFYIKIASYVASVKDILE